MQMVADMDTIRQVQMCCECDLVVFFLPKMKLLVAVF